MIDLKKTITLVQKVSILLQEHIVDTRWEAIVIKPFVYSRKALLTSTITIYGPGDEDMKPTHGVELTSSQPKSKPSGRKRKSV